MDGSVFIHMRNIQSLAVEIFRDSRNLSPTILNDTFTQKGNSWYNLRYISKSSRPLVKSVYHGSDSVSFLEPKIWNMLPDNWKGIDNLYTFKKKVKKWKDENCRCRLCKIYINKKKKKAWKRKNSLGYSSSIFGIMAVAYHYRFATNKYKLLFFLLF